METTSESRHNPKKNKKKFIVLRALGQLGKGDISASKLEKDGWFTSEKIADSSKINIWKIEYYLPILLDKKYIEEKINDGEPIYRITREGVKKSLNIGLF